MTGRTWSEFRLEAFGEPYMVWHDGPDFHEFRTRWLADRPAVEGMLRLGLDEQDPVAAEATRQLASNPDSVATFVPLLAAALPGAPGAFRVQVALALRELTGSEDWSSEVVGVLTSGEHWSVRIDAAMALAHFAPTIDLIAALMRGVMDEEYLVRYHSANSLLTYAGLPADIVSDAETFAQIVDDSTREQRALAASGLAGSASARLVAGAG